MSEGEKMSKTRTHRNQMQWKEAAAGYLCLLPNFIGFAIFTVIPVIMGFLISLTDYNGFPGFKFVGFSNYAAMFRDTLFTTALKNNLIYSFSVVPLTLFTALLLALALNRGVVMNGFFKTVYFFPNLTSMVAVSCVAMMIFQPADGIVNQLLEFFGVAERHLPQWFNATSTALFTVIIVVVWKSAGYYMIILMGGLKNIPAHLYEAAKIDGADTWQCFWNVTWPMLSPTTFMVTILCFISSFQVFDIIQITTDGGPGRATTVLVYRIYKEAFQNWKMGYASAIAYFLFLIIFVITLVQWHGQKKWVND